MQLTKEAKAWYRSAMVWFLGLAGILQAVQMVMPQVHQYVPDAVYNSTMAACIIIGGIARFVRQPKMAQKVEQKS